MNILIISQYYYPEHFLINDIAPELVKRGNSVTVLTGLPNYPKGKIAKEYKWFRKRREVIEGVKVIRCFEIGRRNSRLFLTLNYLSFAFSASIKVLFLRKEFDVVFCYQLSPITMAFPAIVYKKCANVRMLLYCLDIFPESIKSHIKSEKNIIYKMSALVSRYIYNNCDYILVSSKPFINYLHEINNVPKEKMSYLPQHADDRFLNDNLSVQNNNVVDFLFAGNIGYGQNIECIVNAVEIIQGIKNFVVHIVGDGSRLEYIKKMVIEKKLSHKFVFHGRIPFDEMDKFYKLADACLLTLRGNNYVSNTIPGKLQMYMTTGKPIIGAINGAAQEIINESECGVCVNANDYKSLAEVMKDFIENPHKYRNCGENGRKYFRENFTKNNYINCLEKTLNKLL